MPKFRRKQIVVDAIQITHPMSIIVENGPVESGSPTDWFISNELGQQMFITDAEFNANYVEIKKVRKNVVKDPTG